MSDSEFEIIDTRITDHWGVDWTAMEIVRDFLQNFYDANPIEDIKIEINGRTVIVSAPKEFDYKSLIYLGSDKGPSDIGQYGEGFKAATVNAMRNFGCIVQVRINDYFMEFFFESEKIGETEKKIIKCKKSKADKISGTKLILKNCSQEIIEEFEFGLNYFYYKSNPLFGTLLTKHYSNDIMVYKSINNIGYVFYKKLLRAKLDVPLVLVCNRKYKSIDEKIKHDRDRKAFNDNVLELLLKYTLNQVDRSVIVKNLKPWWEKGHKILRILASKYSRIKIHFPDNYYAKHSKTEIINYSMQMQVDQLEQKFQEKGYIQCPVYMAKLGMKSAVAVIREGIEKMKKKHQTLYTRNPTEKEAQALNFLKKYIRDVDRLLADRFSTATFTIGDSDDLIGELRRGRSYRSRNVYLSQSFFLFDFPDALAILIHEWGHIYGFDGSRSFTDALTQFLGAIIKGRNELDKVEKQWSKISLELRNMYLNEKSLPRMHILIERLTNEQKSQLLKSIPEDELLKLIEKENIEFES